MAFSGTFISQIKKKLIYGKSNLTTSAELSATLFNDGHSRSSSSSSSSSSRENSNSRPLNDDSNDYTEAYYPGILDKELTSLTTAQKNIFIVMLTVLLVLSMCGNVCTLFVNFRRKIRPFFRTCLISLAFSDLMNTVFLTASYLSQLTADFVQIWSLGAVMCSLVPFGTTCAILASSMTLVGIALDRYFAVMKAVIGFWNPTVISCIACMLCIWLVSISIACPVFTFYYLIPVYILTAEHKPANAIIEWSTIITATTEVADMNTTAYALLLMRNGSVLMLSQKRKIAIPTYLMKSSAELVTTATLTPWEMEEAYLENLSYTLVRKLKLVNMCMSDPKKVSVYYAIVFTIIFVPCIVAFFWLNTVIARKLWERRHLAKAAKQRNLKTEHQTKSATTCPAFISEPDQSELSATAAYNLAKTLGGKVDKSPLSRDLQANANQSRETRHLRMFTIILLMMALFVILRLPAWIFLLMRMYGSYKKSQYWVIYFIFGLMNLASSVLNPLFYTFHTETLKCVLRVKKKVSSLQCGQQSSLEYFSCGFFLCCCKSSSISALKHNSQTPSLQQKTETSSKECTAGLNNDKDEGVDCNDDNAEDNIGCLHEHEHEDNQQVYTIFPSSLVSSSIIPVNY